MCTEIRHSRGFTLVELIVFIVIVSVALVGVLLAVNHSTAHSADALVRKQALAVAEAILEETMLKPFTWCDPDDAQAATATAAVVGPTGCAVTLEALNAEAGETRGTYDNVNDYNGLNTVDPIIGAAAGSAPNSAAVTVTPTALNGIPSAAALLITVTVTAPGNETVVLQGFRTRHSPNLLP